MLVSVAYDINNYSVKMSKRKKTKHKKFHEQNINIISLILCFIRILL
jgi:hypothetical protein